MAEPCFPVPSIATSSPSPPYFPCTNLLLSLFGVAEPAGSTVARGTGVPGLGMVLEDERGDPPPCIGSGTALFTAQPLQTLEVLQESRDSQSDTPLLPGHRLADPRATGGWREAQPGAGQQVGTRSMAERSRVRETIPSLSSCSGLYLLIPCEKSPVAGPASSPAALRAALPCPAPAGSAVLPCSPADCPLPGTARCSFTCRNTQSSCPSECILQNRARCCY